MTSRIILAAALLALPALEGSDAQLTPREMFYHRDDAPPPPPTATPGHTATTKHRTRTAKPQDTAKAKAAPISQDAPPATETVASTTPPSQAGLGLRYTLVKVTDTGTTDTTDADVFHAGDCVQLKVESNSTGFLYVLHHGPDGNWQPLMPSPKMPDESNRIEAFKDVQIPAKYCFRFDEKPGIETLFLAVAQSEGAIPDLQRAILAGNQQTPADGPTMMALNLNRQVDALRGRGMEISQVERVVETPRDEVRAHAVYVVNTSNTQSDRVVAEIRLRHE
jgi:hypothetical protein